MASKKNKKSTKATTKKKKPPYLLILAGLVVGAGAMMGFTYVRNRKKKTTTGDPASTTSTEKITTTTKAQIKWRDDRLPLVLYSSGPRVLQAQQKLNSKHGAGLKPDGLMGDLTIKALLKHGYKVPLTLESFNALVDGELTVTFDPRKISDDIWTYSNRKDLKNTLTALQKIKSKDDYQAVSKHFLLNRDLSDGFKTHTIVTHMLNFAFASSEPAKELMRDEFERMGLIESDGKWSFSGFGRIPKRLVSIRDTYVIDSAGNRIRIKKGTLIGQQLYSAGAMTSFVAMDGGRGMVPSQHVRIL